MSTRSKFNVDTSSKGKDKRTYEGILFDSEIEMKCYRDYLLPLKREGVVKEIALQPKFTLQPKYEKNGKKVLPIHYVADFEITYSDGRNLVVDIKGLPTSDAKIKRKMFDYVYPEKTLVWWSYSKIDGGWVDVETIEKGRKERKKAKGK
jgi:hypothetical protein